MAADPCPKLPRNQEAERAVLGAILLDNQALNPALEILRADDFFLDAHRRIFRCMIGLSEANRAIDLVTLADELRRAGEIEAAGGVAYLSSLVDGVPRVSNVQHYARIVKEKAVLCRWAAAGEEIVQAVVQPDATVEAIRARFRNLLDSSALVGEGGLVVVNTEEFLKMELAPREMVLAPILPVQGLGMLYSKRGVGKTYLALEIAHAVACGRPCLRWAVPKPRPVLYVDGELPATTLRDRLASIIAGSEGFPARDTTMFRLITPDLQNGPLPDLATREGQVLIEDHLNGTELLILDSLSALCRAGKENEGESWLPIQDWALGLRRRGVSVLFVHHAGKGGAQRGTSRREDLLDVVLALRHPADYSPWEGLRCEVHYEKARGFLGSDAKPFELRLETDDQGIAQWTMRAIEDAIEMRAAELFAEGLSVRDVAEELGISKSRAHRLKNRVKAELPPG